MKEGIDFETPKNDSAESAVNFHEVSQNRKELRQAISELDGRSGAIFNKHYKEPLAEADEQASEFKVADFGGLKGAKEALKKQKAEYEQILDDHAQIDYEEILKVTPEVGETRKILKNIDRPHKRVVICIYDKKPHRKTKKCSSIYF